MCVYIRSVSRANRLLLSYWMKQKAKPATFLLLLVTPGLSFREVSAHMHMGAYKSDVPSDSSITPCLVRPVVLGTVTTVVAMGSTRCLLARREAMEPQPVVPCLLCVYPTGDWPLLRTSLVKIYSQRNGRTVRPAERRGEE